jgi:hypothetical protein
MGASQKWRHSSSLLGSVLGVIQKWRHSSSLLGSVLASSIYRHRVSSLHREYDSLRRSVRNRSLAHLHPRKSATVETME